ncbi:hypothetical protein ACIQNG_13865 [Streptomyces sp. NPDC091377]|uniref:hypothetical protein n=1 Tax=Streptomyces sp. NPDC091377 TaxID=3365995 RepID=UPI00381CC09B
MPRTRTEQARRTQIADAATGGVRRISVVLYVCLPDGHTERVLTDLRAYAAARDWSVADELVDPSGAATPMTDRPQWARLAELIESGQAQGIVTPIHRLCGLREADQEQFDTWLAVHRAFVVNVPNADPIESAARF